MPATLDPPPNVNDRQPHAAAASAGEIWAWRPELDGAMSGETVAPARAPAPAAAPASDAAPTPTNACPAARPSAEARPGRVRRWTLAAIGVLCVALGGLGVVVPGLPTTIFLIVASACFARSCPWLERRLLRNRLFGPYMRYVDRSEPMPRKAKLASIGIIWVFSLASAAFLVTRDGSGPVWAAGLVLLAAAAGTAAVLRWNARSDADPLPKPAPVAAAPEPDFSRPTS
jgi:hypothetical protein